MNDDNVTWYTSISSAHFPKPLTLICDADDTYYWIFAGIGRCIFDVSGEEQVYNDKVARPFRICESRSEFYGAITALLDRDVELVKGTHIVEVVANNNRAVYELDNPYPTCSTRPKYVNETERKIAELEAQHKAYSDEIQRKISELRNPEGTACT